MTIDPSGIVYVADQPNCTVRRIVLPASAPPSITTQPSAQTVNSGGNASFTVASGIHPSPSFQWQVKHGWRRDLDESERQRHLQRLRHGHIDRQFGQRGDEWRFVPTAWLPTLAGSVTSSPATLVVDTPLAVVTLAGLAGSTAVPTAPATGARFAVPSDVATDASGNIYVADTGNHTVRKVTPAGLVTTFAGQAGVSGSNDGTAAPASIILRVWRWTAQAMSMWPILITMKSER